MTHARAVRVRVMLTLTRDLIQTACTTPIVSQTLIISADNRETLQFRLYGRISQFNGRFDVCVYCARHFVD